MRAVLVLAVISALLFIYQPHAHAGEPGPLSGRSMNTLGVPPGMEDAAETGEAEQAEPVENALPADYYTQKVEIIQGVISAVDPENNTISIMTGDAETLYNYDGLTRFQVKLKPVCPTELKPGQKIAGLYREKDGSLYISRVVVITGEPYKASKKKSSKSKKSRRSKKRRRR